MVSVDGFFEHRLGGNFSLLESARSELSFRKIAHGPGHAAYLVRLQRSRLQALSQNHFGRAPANINHQAALVGLRQQMRDTLVNQSGFFTARNHVDGKPQCFLPAPDKFFAVDGFAQRLGGHGPHLRFVKACQAFAKARQTIPSALHGGQRQVAVFIESAALAHGFLDVFDAVDAAVVKTSNFKAKAVGPQVHSGNQCSVLHV